ncbi:hypothetical protein CI109_101851 [Kwoniella shandongensis]|uniref:Uncharacterized protein n=1 Tax=Kwoniella shandongensis TaxID=1734106 RepID=A0A5M6BSQ4_9TREE|nr:uncharacterized protein CI109_007031 [Kwoniella shandongensis]KAA5524645.1 hypothetical protein CI109_007031 [Kwoniella shandongensis]
MLRFRSAPTRSRRAVDIDGKDLEQGRINDQDVDEDGHSPVGESTSNGETASLQVHSATTTRTKPVGHRAAPPWRRPLGRSFFFLPSPIGEYTPSKESQLYIPVLERTFEGFSETEVGSDVEIVDLSSKAGEDVGGSGEMDWDVDLVPRNWVVEGDTSEVIYDEPPRGDDLTAGNNKTNRFTNQQCWNCLLYGHSVANCPQPRNHAQIQQSRDSFMYQKDFAMPESALQTYETYLSMRVTEDEKSRRLELLDQYRPGVISDGLVDAICHLDEGILEGEEEEMDEVRRRIDTMRRRKQWEWLRGIMRWGYPPGWIAGKDPIQELRKRVGSLRVYEKPFDNAEEDTDELLNIYGGGIGTPTPTSPSSLVDEGSSDIDEDSDSDSDDDDDEATVRGRSRSVSLSMSIISDSESDSGSATPKALSTRPLYTSPPRDEGTPRPPPPPEDERPSSPPPPRPLAGDEPPPPPPDDGDPPPPPPPPYAPPPPPSSPPPSPPQLPPHHTRPPPSPYPSYLTHPSLPRSHRPRLPPTPLRRWAKYHTDLFDSDRLVPYSETRPLPLGM